MKEKSNLPDSRLSLSLLLLLLLLLALPEYIVYLVFLMQDKTGAGPMGWTKIIVIAQFAFQIA